MSRTLMMKFSPSARNLNKFLDLKAMKAMDSYSHFNPSPLSLKELVNFGQKATEDESFQYIRREVPLRLANIMKEINCLPSTLLQMPSMMQLQVCKTDHD